MPYSMGIILFYLCLCSGGSLYIPSPVPVYNIIFSRAHKLIRVLSITWYQFLGFFFSTDVLACVISSLPSYSFSGCRTIQPVTLSKTWSASQSFKIISLLLECFFLLLKVNPFYGTKKIRNMSWRSAIGQYNKNIFSFAVKFKVWSRTDKRWDAVIHMYHPFLFMSFFKGSLH
jgi:hypothetical protein